MSKRKPRPVGDEVVQFHPGDSSMVKMAKVTRWALMRGGTFKAMELKERFGCSRPMAYAYWRAWVQVFGYGPPLRSYSYRAQDPPASGNGQPEKRIDLSSLL